MRQTAAVRCPAGISVSFFHALRCMGEDMEKDRLIRFLLLLIVLGETLRQPLIAFGVEGHIVKDDRAAKAIRSRYIPLQQRRAAAQAAYDRSMTALNNSYNTMQNSLKGNYNSTLGQLEQNYNTGVAGVNKQADNAQQQAYINYMMNKRDMGQQLAAQGLSGGASESALAGMYNNYGNSRNTIDSGRNDSLADLMNDWNTNKASALQAYNSQLAEMAMQKANAVQQLENNLANLIANAATANYDTQFSLSSDYLSKMMDLASKGGSYAAAVANRAYSPTNALLTASTQQGAAATPAVFNAYQQAQQALDAQLAAANPGLYTVRGASALPTYTL